MILVNPKAINLQLNKCYLEYDPYWPDDAHNRVPAFKYYLERTAGVKLDFEPKIDHVRNRVGYEVHRVEVVDNKKYTMWLIKYS